MIDVFTRGNPEFTVVDGIWGMGAFQRRTASRFIHPTLTPEGEEHLRGTIRIIAGLPGSGKTTYAEEDTEMWTQNKKLNEELARLGLPPLTNRHARMDWSLYEVRRRAGVLGMDYETQSQDYIMEASSALMSYTLDCAIKDLRPPWKINVEVVLAPFPLRNYNWTAIKLITRNLAKKSEERKAENLPESEVVEFVGFTPDQPLYEKAFQERRAQEKELILGSQAGAPPEILSWIDTNTKTVIDEMIRTRQLPGVPTNYGDSYEKKSYAIRRLFRWYAYDFLGEHAKTRSLIGINKSLNQPIQTQDPNAFKEKFSLPFNERAVELFGETGLGAFKPDSDVDKQRVKVSPPGIKWLAEIAKKQIMK